MTRVSRLFFCSWRYVNSALNSGWHNRKPLLLKNNSFTSHGKTWHYCRCQFLQTRYKWYQWIPLYAFFLRLFTSIQNHQHIRSIESDLETIVLEEIKSCHPGMFIASITICRHSTKTSNHHTSILCQFHTFIYECTCINFSSKITSKDKVTIQCKQPHRISSDHAIDTPLMFIMSHPNQSWFELRLTI